MYVDLAAITATGAADAEGFFDVIVTDPPYGIRAGAKKSGQVTGDSIGSDRTGND